MMTKVFGVVDFQKAIGDEAIPLLINEDIVAQLSAVWSQLYGQKINKPRRTLLRLLRFAVFEPNGDDTTRTTFVINEIRFHVQTESTNYRVTRIESARPAPLPHPDLPEMDIHRVEFPNYLLRQFVIDFRTCYGKNPTPVICEARRLLADTKKYRTWILRISRATRRYAISQPGNGRYLYFRSKLWNFTIMREGNKFVIIMVSPVTDDVDLMY